jgi:predicted HicB family RNase H-like nuclease
MSTTIPDIRHYTYRVTWSSEDAEFVGTCLEFPSLPWLGSTQDEALHGIRDVVRDVVEDLNAKAETIPEPLSSRAYSGKFNLRVGERLHRKLALESRGGTPEPQPVRRATTRGRFLSAAMGDMRLEKAGSLTAIDPTFDKPCAR